MQQFSCPACSAPLMIENRFVKMITCEFCGQVSFLTDKGLDPTGKTAKLVQLPSRFYVGAIGTLKGREFSTLGRLRYQYDSGYWDEWFLTFDGEQPGWLVEDEGTYVLCRKTKLTGEITPYDQVRVGATVNIGGKQVFVTEKGRSQIAGGEGQLAFTVIPGEQVYYLDGTTEGKLISVEYHPNEIEVSIGSPIDYQEIIIDEDDF